MCCLIRKMNVNTLTLCMYLYINFCDKSITGHRYVYENSLEYNHLHTVIIEYLLSI